MSYVFPAFGAAVALAGGDKLAGLPAYEGMFSHLGWSREAMQLTAAAEVTGGLLMLTPATRGIGGALIMAASAAILSSELERGDARLALPRGLILATALAAMLTPRRRRNRTAWVKTPAPPSN